MATVIFDPFPNLARFEQAVRACFDGVQFDVVQLRDRLKQFRLKMNPDDGYFRQGIEVLESGDKEKIAAWLLSLEMQLS